MRLFDEKLQTLWNQEVENLSTGRVPHIPIPSFDEILPEMLDGDPAVLLEELYRKNGQVKVVVEGLGKCFHSRYLRPLIERVESGKIKLWLVDVLEEMPLQIKERLSKKVIFLSKSKGSDEHYWQSLHADVVFVLTPDVVHCDVAEEWLGRAKLILVEKPFDASLRRALDFIEPLKLYPETRVYYIDHYYIKADALFCCQNWVGLLEEGIRSSTFFLLESQLIDPSRADSLVNGMIPDLGSHGVALHGGIGPLSAIRLGDVFAASYVGSPIRSETFASIPFEIKSVPSQMIVGKAHKTNQKYWEICGLKKRLRLDFARQAVWEKRSHESEWHPLRKPSIPPDAHAHMIHHLFGGITNGFVEKKGMFLSLQRALQILAVLEAAKSSIQQKGIYTAGQDWKKILPPDLANRFSR